MVIDKELWQRAIRIMSEMERRSEIITREKLRDLLQIGVRTADNIRFAFQNRQMINFNPEIQVSKAVKEVVINDVHIPYHDKLAVESVIDFIDYEKPDVLALNGDIIDFYKISRFTVNPSKVGVSEEINQVKNFLIDLRNKFPDMRIIYKEGNHEVRLQNYLMSKVSEIYNLVTDLYQSKLELKELNIEYIVEPFKIGNLWHLHGHEKPAGSYNPEYITNVLWQYINNHFICGHYHRNQHKIFKQSLDKKTFWAGAVGYLAGEMDYALLNKWTQGVALIQHNSNKEFRANIFEIENGRII